MIEIIPSLYIYNGKCIKPNFENLNDSIVYPESVMDMAKKLENAGLFRIVINDLNSYKLGSLDNKELIKAICSQTKLKVVFNGSIKTRNDVRDLLKIGIERVICSDIAQNQPNVFSYWLVCYSEDQLAYSSKLDNEKLDQQLELYIKDGLKRVYIDCETLDNDNIAQHIEKFKAIAEKYSNIRFTFNCNANNIEHIQMLNDANLASVIVGNPLYEEGISVDSITNFYQVNRLKKQAQEERERLLAPKPERKTSTRPDRKPFRAKRDGAAFKEGGKRDGKGEGKREFTKKEFGKKPFGKSKEGDNKKGFRNGKRDINKRGRDERK